jgi:hypothetical protein
MIFKKKRKIEWLKTKNGETFEVCEKGDFVKYPEFSSAIMDECSIKHIGNQIYLVGYFDENKGGNYNRIGNAQNMINKWTIIFPSEIKRIEFK